MLSLFNVDFDKLACILRAQKSTTLARNDLYKAIRGHLVSAYFKHRKYEYTDMVWLIINVTKTLEEIGLIQVVKDPILGHKCYRIN